tara:strand:- start:2027 stop:2329 length:303 start_codon:yes stop_codon:yes gene_type:complete
MATLVSILVSIWLHLEARKTQPERSGIRVSILVSNWMHLEAYMRSYVAAPGGCFNPSFYLDVSGTKRTSNNIFGQCGFNPSLYLDVSGTIRAKVKQLRKE